MDNGKSVFEKLIKDDRAAHEQKTWRGTFLDYLERVREDPSLPKLAHSRNTDSTTSRTQFRSSMESSTTRSRS